MNRPIKFRAFEKASATMYYDVIVSDNILITEYYTDKDAQLEPESYWLNRKIHDHDFIIMQFTGYTGKKGVEIYEGDKVRIGNRIATVVWIDGGFGFTDQKDWLDEWNWADDAFRMTVVGNIYENN